ARAGCRSSPWPTRSATSPTGSARCSPAPTPTPRCSGASWPRGRSPPSACSSATAPSAGASASDLRRRRARDTPRPGPVPFLQQAGPHLREKRRPLVRGNGQVPGGAVPRITHLRPLRGLGDLDALVRACTVTRLMPVEFHRSPSRTFSKLLGSRLSDEGPFPVDRRDQSAFTQFLAGSSNGHVGDAVLFRHLPLRWQPHPRPQLTRPDPGGDVVGDRQIDQLRAFRVKGRKPDLLAHTATVEQNFPATPLFLLLRVLLHDEGSLSVNRGRQPSVVQHLDGRPRSGARHLELLTQSGLRGDTAPRLIGPVRDPSRQHGCDLLIQRLWPVKTDLQTPTLFRPTQYLSSTSVT